MPDDQKNFLFALALSLIVIFLWEIWFTPEQPSPVQSQTQKPHTPLQEKSNPQTFAMEKENDSLWTPTDTNSPKISIKTEKLDGALQQSGAVFDQLLLLDYRQTVDKNSPPIQFLKPNKLGAVFGWSGAQGEIVNQQTQWVSNKNRLTQNQSVLLTYHDTKTNLYFSREISVDQNYMFQIKDTIINKSTQAQPILAWAMVRRFERPTISGFYLLHEGLIGFSPQHGLEEIDYDDLEDEPEIKFKGAQGWLGITDKYWAAIIIPDQKYKFTARFTRSVTPSTEIFAAHYVGEPIRLAAGEGWTSTQHFFAGAKVNSLIENYMEKIPITHFDLIIDWGWFFFLTKPFFLLLDFFSKFSGNFGVAILIVTVLVKLAFFPLANKSYETMAMMRKMQPEIELVRARNKGDMMAQNREIAELWKKHDVKPLMGCLPMFLQIPVFFALYKVLFVTIEMRHASFFGWIEDLSAPDPTSLFNLFGLIPISLPDFLIIGIWPLFMGLSMFVQMRLNPPPPDPIQRKVFAWAPLVITLLLARFPVGLVIYASWNTVLSALQQGFIMKKQGVEINLLENLGLKK